MKALRQIRASARALPSQSAAKKTRLTLCVFAAFLSSGWEAVLVKDNTRAERVATTFALNIEEG